MFQVPGSISATDLNLSGTVMAAHFAGDGASLTGIPWASVAGKPTVVSAFTNDAGYLTAASNLAWARLTGIPAVSAFTNDAGYVQSSGSYANPGWLTALAWSKLTGAPDSFTPSAHAASHMQGGSDPITGTGDLAVIGTLAVAGGYDADPAMGTRTFSFTGRVGGVGFYAGVHTDDTTSWFQSMSILTRTPHAFVLNPLGGYVGIGKLFPTVELDLVGSAAVSGTVTAAHFAGDGASITGVTWAHITGAPTAVSAFTNDSGYLTAASNLAWGKLTGVPSTFAPSAHTHAASDINSGTLNIARIPTGTSSVTVALGNHLHAGVYEPVDATILRIGGSYADPAWLTSLAKSKVGLGSAENTAISSWAGTANIVTVGTITTGVWHGTAIADSYIAAAATWNAKQNAISGAPGSWPAAFAPSAHASNHSGAGSDPITSLGAVTFSGSILARNATHTSAVPAISYSYAGLAFLIDPNDETALIYGYDTGNQPIFQVAAKPYNAGGPAAAWDPSGTVRLNLLGNGDFAIGSQYPGAKLDVAGAIKLSAQVSSCPWSGIANVPNFGMCIIPASTSALLDFAVLDATGSSVRFGIHSSGSVDLYTGLTIYGTSASTVLTLLGPQSSGYASGYTTYIQGNRYGNSFNILGFGNTHSNRPATMQIGVFNTEQNLALMAGDVGEIYAGTCIKGIFIKAGGNVGVATANPGAKFEVGDGTAAADIAIYGNVSGSKQSWVKMRDVSGTIIGLDIGAGNATTIRLDAWAGATSYFSVGNLAVGATGTAFRFQVCKDSVAVSSQPFGDWQNNGQVAITGAANTAKRLAMGVDTTLTPMVAVIQSMEAGVSCRQLALNPSGGAVGVGTMSPYATLTVCQDFNNAATGLGASPMMIVGKTNPNKTLFIGFDTSIDHGYIQAGVNFASWNALCLNPVAGAVLIGTWTDAGYKVQIQDSAPVLALQRTGPLAAIRMYSTSAPWEYTQLSSAGAVTRLIGAYELHLQSDDCISPTYSRGVFIESNNSMAEYAAVGAQRLLTVRMDADGTPQDLLIVRGDTANVGINIMPTVKFHVAGGAAATTVLLSRFDIPRSFSTAADGMVIGFTSNATLGSHDFGALFAGHNTATGDGGGGVVELRVGGASTTGGLGSANAFLQGKALMSGYVNQVSLRTSGVDRLIVDAFGNVGIGPGAPGTLLDINSPDNARIYLKKTGVNAGAAAIFNDGNLHIEPGANDQPIWISTWCSANIWMAIGGGNVSIGATLATAHKFNVCADISDPDVGQIAARGLSDTTLTTSMGYSTSGDFGYVSAYRRGYVYKNLKLQANGGYVILGAPASAVADAGLANSQVGIWYDEGNNRLVFRVKSSAGVLKTGYVTVQ